MSKFHIANIDFQKLNPLAGGGEELKICSKISHHSNKIGRKAYANSCNILTSLHITQPCQTSQMSRSHRKIFKTHVPGPLHAWFLLVRWTTEANYFSHYTKTWKHMYTICFTQFSHVFGLPIKIHYSSKTCSLSSKIKLASEI